MTDTLAHTKYCSACSSPFEIVAEDILFYEKISPTFAGQRFQIPPPSLCPDCRQQRRLSFRNERSLYKRKCDASGKDIISIYSPDKDYKVYDQKIWRSDDRDPLQYGREFDFTKTFSEQFGEMLHDVPFMAIMNDSGVVSVNSDYCNNFSYGKNCYLVHTTRHAEDSMYSSSCNHIVTTVDSDGMGNTSECYSCIDCGKLQNCHFLQNSFDSHDCFYGCSLNGCDHCIGCVNLSNKSYHAFNTPVSKNEFEELKKKLTTTAGMTAIYEQYKKLLDNSPRRQFEQSNCGQSLGDHIFGCTHVLGYNIYNGKDCKYYYGGADSPRESYDITVGGDHDLGYESIVPDFSYQSCFTVYCRKCKYIYYSFDCHGSSDIFGSIGLRGKQYCIFNKQYSKDEYEKTVAKIITHMQETPIGSGQGYERGEFFDPSLSPFGYNETVAQEYYPLTQEPSKSVPPLSKGNEPPPGEGRAGVGFFNRSTYESPVPQVEKIFQAGELPESIKEVSDDILKVAIRCEVTNKPFRITPQELAFYRKHHLPLPRRHPDQRHLDRMALRNPRRLFTRVCNKCGITMQTSYTPERPETVYCESCFVETVY